MTAMVWDGTAILNVTFASNVTAVGAVGNFEVFTQGAWRAVTTWAATANKLAISAIASGSLSLASAVRTLGAVNVTFANALPANFPETFP